MYDVIHIHEYYIIIIHVYICRKPFPDAIIVSCEPATAHSRTISCCIVSHRQYVTSCHVMPCHAMSCHVMSWHVPVRRGIGGSEEETVRVYCIVICEAVNNQHHDITIILLWYMNMCVRLSVVVSYSARARTRRQTGTILYYTILYYTILYYNILYYTILYPRPRRQPRLARSLSLRR